MGGGNDGKRRRGRGFSISWGPYIMRATNNAYLVVWPISFRGPLERQHRQDGIPRAAESDLVLEAVCFRDDTKDVVIDTRNILKDNARND